MNRQELRDYANWRGKNALEIRKHVIRAGGWDRVFPFGFRLPREIHLARNAFNECPPRIQRVSDQEAEAAIRAAGKGYRKRSVPKRWSSFGHTLPMTPESKFALMTNHIPVWMAPSGDVYRDFLIQPNKDGVPVHRIRYWIGQSVFGSSMHHDGNKSPIASRSEVGVFKLLAADGTGGSIEICIRNPGGKTGTGKLHAAAVGGWVDTIGRSIKDPKYRASYNFSDTMLTGFFVHGRFDMVPDDVYGQGYTVTPGPTNTPLQERIFP